MAAARETKRPWAAILRRAVVAVFLGAITTAGVSTWLALRQPLDGTTAIITPAGVVLRNAATPRITIASDGNHLQPWHLLIEVPGARREIWFEKARVYGARDAATPMHPESVACAVSCWSFATQSRATATKASLPLDPSLATAIGSGPPPVWGAAVDRRGWPFLAFEARISGTIEANAMEPWRLDGAIDWDNIADDRDPAVATATSAPVPRRAGPISVGISLASVRFIPMAPLWPGLLGNIAIYAVVWYGLMLIPPWILARFRKQVGACPACGYDLIGQREPGCPECGHGRVQAEAGGSQNQSRPLTPSPAGPAHTPG